MQESPKFLIYKDRDEEALRALRYVCKMNGRQCGITSDMFKIIMERHGNFEEESAAGPGSDQEVNGTKSQTVIKSKLDLGRIKLLFADRITSRSVLQPLAMSLY